MFFLFRAATSGGGRPRPRKPPGANAQAGWALVILAVLTAIGIKVPAFGIGVLAFAAVTIGAALCVAGSRPERPKQDKKLDDLMAQYQEKP